VPTSIRHLVEKLKSFIADDGFYMATLLILVSVASFGLGRQSIIESKPIKTLENKSSVIMTESVKPASNLAPTPIQNIPEDESEAEAAAIEGEVVASKSGTKYHLPTCSGAKTIKPENLITFVSRAEAEAAGYTPAANCKGLNLEN
jgi:Metal binding domain of Ada